MIRRYKNVYGDGTVEYIEIDVPEETPDDEEVTDEELLEMIGGIL